VRDTGGRKMQKPCERCGQIYECEIMKSMYCKKCNIIVKRERGIEYYRRKKNGTKK